MLDLIDVLDNDGYTLKFSREFSPEEQDFRGERIVFDKPVIITGYAKNMRGIVEIYSSVKGSIVTECARCTDTAMYPFSFDYTDTVAVSPEEDGLELVGTSVDLGGAVLKEILCRLTLSILCVPGCRGLCPKCGINLNRATCDCTSFESDAVWEKLKNLNLNDEV